MAVSQLHVFWANLHARKSLNLIETIHHSRPFIVCLMGAAWNATLIKFYV